MQLQPERSATAPFASNTQYRDYADHNRSKEITLPATQLLRRILLHVVPRGFMRIRHYSITANRHREQKLARARSCSASRRSSWPKRSLRSTVSK